MSKQKILVVEDENLTRAFLLNMIESLDYIVDSAENGEEAISKISSFQPNLIISDVLMPEFSGLQLLNFVQKKIPQKIPVLLISTMEESVMSEMVEDVGAAGFISKPPIKNELKEKILNALK